MNRATALSFGLHNQTLSEQRAASVTTWLVDRGAARSRLQRWATPTRSRWRTTGPRGPVREPPGGAVAPLTAPELDARGHLAHACASTRSPAGKGPVILGFEHPQAVGRGNARRRRVTQVLVW